MSSTPSDQLRHRNSKSGKPDAEFKAPLTNLIDNAFDFLSGALFALDKDPKRSVIDFYTAVELFLKAPLLKEHWTLVVDRSPSIDKFRSGDFVSVSFDEATRRLENVLASPLSKESIEAFNKVRKHRNQYVHFSAPNSDSAKPKIAAEQLQAWAALHRLITHQWADIFKSYAKRTGEIESKLRVHREFATAYAKSRLPDFKPELDAARSAGHLVSNCSTCQVSSKVSINAAGRHYSSRCLICKLRHDAVHVQCPKCGKESEYSGGDYMLECDCGGEIDHAAIAKQLNTTPTLTKHNYFDHQGPANCGFCDGFETVVPYHEHHLCLQCMELTHGVYLCEWCSKPSNIPQADTYVMGCSDCDGATGHRRD